MGMGMGMGMVRATERGRGKGRGRGRASVMLEKAVRVLSVECLEKGESLGWGPVGPEGGSEVEGLGAGVGVREVAEA